VEVTKIFVLSNGTLIDGTRHKPIQKAIVIINGNRIEDVGSRIKCSENANMIDLHGLTIMPGLIDCHLHLGGLTIDKPGKAIGKVSFIDRVAFFCQYSANQVF
jgi:imidazolonepropionase-like amidohydrolase